jgi:hypothetical protein
VKGNNVSHCDVFHDAFLFFSVTSCNGQTAAHAKALKVSIQFAYSAWGLGLSARITGHVEVIAKLWHFTYAHDPPVSVARNPSNRLLGSLALPPH